MSPNWKTDDSKEISPIQKSKSQKKKKNNALLKTQEECETYFANLILSQGKSEDEDSEQDQQTSNTPAIPDLFDYMSTFTQSTSKSTKSVTQKSGKTRENNHSESESSLSSSDSSSSSSLSSNSAKTKRKNKKKRTRKHQKKYTKLFNKLCKSANHHKLKSLKLEGNPKEKRKATVLWIETIKDILSTDPATADILENYPRLPKKLPNYVNKALGSFLRAQMAYHVKKYAKWYRSKGWTGNLTQNSRNICTSLN